ncbi:uncharacterized protein [Halyomorpha halys]|uniref:uncharacterized protein n=1 Tax=Halyomorpha halys TaxID=286706 RepID=UPI0034D2ACAE
MIQKRHTRLASEEYKNKRRQEKRVHRRKKREWERKQFEEMEPHRAGNGARAFYKKINESMAPFKPRIKACRKEEGSLLSRKEEILNRWWRYFSALLNEGVEETFEAHDMQDDLYLPDPPTFNDVVDALSGLNNNKAPGEDEIPTELLRYGSEELHKALYDILTIWIDERIPEEWKAGIITPLHM